MVRSVRRREFKRREKQREKEARKAQKAAEAPPKVTAKATTAEVNEEDLNPNVSDLSDRGAMRRESRLLSKIL